MYLKRRAPVRQTVRHSEQQFRFLGQIPIPLYEAGYTAHGCSSFLSRFVDPVECCMAWSQRILSFRQKS